MFFSELNANSPKSILFEILGLSKNTSVDEKFFDILVEKLDELGIEEDELSDGYEFMGGSRALNSYVNKNATRLVILMGGVLENEGNLKKNEKKETVPDKIIEKKKEGFLFEQFENIESDEKPVDRSVNSESDIYTIGGYYSIPMILSKTTEFFDRKSANINGFNIVTPFRLKKLGRVLEAIAKSKPGLLNPRAMIEIRAYYFEKVISDSVKEIFGGSSYFLIGFYDKVNFNGRETDFSFLMGKTHFNSLGFVLTNGTQIPLNIKNKNLKIYMISKATLMHKFEDRYTGWLDIGLSIRYDINNSKIAKSKGLIKRRQSIID
tara:strand:+ start:254 stop:1216 length:963 start_codon:yes stop_codon:yes gene_type:complete